jgi:hypothetical protein
MRALISKSEAVMRHKLDNKTVGDLLDLKANDMLYVNREYQRGPVWSKTQKRLLVDSVLRGYPIPLIYLHHISKEVAQHKLDKFEVIDGQQRINALYEYREGAFKLFDPQNQADADEAQFPSFIQQEPCPWAGKRFDELTAKLQEQMLGELLALVMVTTDVSDESRDLFIRLQAGMPLNSQEKRDAWPGSFTEYILKIAGKPEIPRYPGHDFFAAVMKAKSANRGEYRQLAAQMVMLYQTRRDSGKYCDINADAIDAFYHKHLDFDANSADAKRFSQILDMLINLLGDGKRKKIRGHEAMGLVLLVDSLLDDYTKSWQKDFTDAFDNFRLKVAEATQERFDDPSSEYWARYGQLTRANSDRAVTIERRHIFFADEMRRKIKPLLKDATRAFGQLEREIIYMRDQRRCQVPGHGEEVLWADAEIHHVEQHAHGGRTVLENGALVHKNCHPKSQKDVAKFPEHWETKTTA